MSNYDSNIDYLEAAEKDFIKVISLVPDHASALNALGYTLADRTDRLNEAQKRLSEAEKQLNEQLKISTN